MDTRYKLSVIILLDFTQRTSIDIESKKSTKATYIARPILAANFLIRCHRAKTCSMMGQL